MPMAMPPVAFFVLKVRIAKLVPQNAPPAPRALWLHLKAVQLVKFAQQVLLPTQPQQVVMLVQQALWLNPRAAQLVLNVKLAPMPMLLPPAVTLVPLAPTVLLVLTNVSTAHQEPQMIPKAQRLVPNALRGLLLLKVHRESA